MAERRYVLVTSPLVEKTFKRIKRTKPELLDAAVTASLKALRNPLLGKPLRNVYRNCRRMHVFGSYVLVYEIKEFEVHLLDFDHHDRIYKKYSR